MAVSVANAPVPKAPGPRRAVGLRTLLASRKARVGLLIVGTIMAIAVLAPLIAPGDPSAYVGKPSQPPSVAHILGTDPQGKDVLALTVWGGRISLFIGFASAFLMTLIATIVGMISGYAGGVVDEVLTFVMNLFLVIPGLPLLVLLAAYLEPSTQTVIIALALTGWAFNARLIRAQTLSLREKDFVAAAIVSGERTGTIIFRQILPNMVNVIIGGLIGAVVYGITAATGLAFLGLASTGEVTWGTNLFWAQNGGALMIGAWWTFLPPGLAVAFVAFGLALINYGMDEVTNPRLVAERKLKKLTRDLPASDVRATPVVLRSR
jgi:peptide/nickel transport system permease protein